LSRKILSAPVSKRDFKRGISSAQILKGEILNGEFLALNFKSGFRKHRAAWTTLQARKNLKALFKARKTGENFLIFSGGGFKK